MNATDGFWTPERLVMLHQLHAAGLPYAEIGQRLGTTKNAISGKVYRMGLNTRRPKRMSTTSTTLSRLEALDVFPGHGNCVFPLGHPGTPEFNFCGCDVQDIADPYCAKHRRMAWRLESETAARIAAWTPERKAKHQAMMRARHQS